MFSARFSTFAWLLSAGCFSSSGALPRPTQEAVNDRPVIGKLSVNLVKLKLKRELLTTVSSLAVSCPTGVLTQIVSDEVLKPFGSTFIPASYVKYLESGGSRVMPIR